jgi:hypothetical protein
MPELFSLNLYAPLPAHGLQHSLDINPDITSLKFTTGPGGFQALNVGLRDPDVWDVRGAEYGYLPRPIEIQGLSHVTLTIGGYTCFEGRLLIPARPASGEIRGFSATGYGIHAVKDNWYTGTSSTLQSAGSLLQAVLVQAAPLLQVNPYTFGDTNIMHAPTEVDGFFPAQVIAQFSTEGTGSGVAAIPYDWAVWENRLASWQARSVPQQVQYQMGFDDSVPQWDEDYTDLYGSVAVRYTVFPAANPPVIATTPLGSNPATVGLYGISRSTLLQGGTVTAVAATQFRDTQLAYLSTPRVAGAIRRIGRGLPRPGGSEADPWLPRFGEWVQVGDQPPAMIVGTSYDAMPVGGSIYGTLEVTLQNYPRSMFRGLLDLQRSAQQIAWKTSPVSGAKQ